MILNVAKKNILDMIQDVPRIIPYSLNKKTKKLEFKELDGLLEYQDSILYLKEDYAYYKRITRFDFTDFNKIYDNEALRIVGKIMEKL